MPRTRRSSWSRAFGRGSGSSRRGSSSGARRVTRRLGSSGSSGSIPPFAVGHWVPEQIRRAGGWDLLGQDGEASSQTDWGAVVDVDPEMIVLMPCGFHLSETVAEWERTPRPIGWTSIEAVRRGNVFAVDGSAYFSRPGPRVLDGIEMLAEIFDPDAFVETAPPGSWTPLT